MFDGLRRELRHLRESRPGTRFQRGHDRHRVDNRVLRVILISFGATIAILGAITFWLPGPNFVLVLAGLAVVAAQWRFVARQLDRGEVTMRELNDRYWDPYPHKRRVLVIGWLVGASIVAAALWLAWRNDWLPAWLPYVS